MVNRTCPEWIAQVRYETGPWRVRTFSSSTSNILAFQNQPDAEAYFLVDEDTSSPTHRATHEVSIFGPFSWRKIQNLKMTPSTYRLDWAKKVSLAAICLVAGSASFGLREN